MYVHLTLLPWVPTAGELKTKPTQHSVKELLSVGIQPDLLVCRSGDKEIPANERRKIALFCNVKPERVIEARDVDTIYQVPIAYHDQGFDREVCSISARGRQGARPRALARRGALVREPEGKVTIAVVGKYTVLLDAYKSLARR
jgi:CTP synthase